MAEHFLKKLSKMSTPLYATLPLLLVQHKPKIDTCRLGIEDDMGNVFNSTFVSNTTSCSDTIDTFVNIHPMELFFTFEFIFRLLQDPPEEKLRHKYVDGYSFGIVDGDVTVYLYQKSTGGGKNEYLILQYKGVDVLQCSIS